MKVLWITNVPLPPLCDSLGWNVPVSGGWLYSIAKRLISKKSLELSVVTFGSKRSELIDKIVDGIHYFVIPYKNGDIETNHQFVRDYLKKINEQITPDVVHIQGTEFALGNDYLKVFGGDRVVVSIQGLVSAIAPYYCSGVERSKSLFPLTLKDVVKRTSMMKSAKIFSRRGEIEKDTIKMVEHIIGRTEWDKAQTWAINPHVNYYHCDEIIRDTFYKKQWDYNFCKPHSIFISQAGYPLKGFHFVLKALPKVIEEFPDTMVFVAGPDITRKKPWYRYNSYGKYIGNMIEELGLESHVTFLGNLNETQMCDSYLKSNVFICPSSIENSPNSLGEAQLLGVPSLASYVGGVPDMMYNNTENIYRFDDVAMLSFKICKLFEKKGEAQPAEEIRLHALQRHSPDEIIIKTLQIYQLIIDSQN